LKPKTELDRLQLKKFKKGDVMLDFTLASNHPEI